MNYISKYIYDYNHSKYSKHSTFKYITKLLKSPIPKNRTLNHRIVNIIVFSRIYLNK